MNWWKLLLNPLPQQPLLPLKLDMPMEGGERTVTSHLPAHLPPEPAQDVRTFDKPLTLPRRRPLEPRFISQSGDVAMAGSTPRLRAMKY